MTIHSRRYGASIVVARLQKSLGILWIESIRSDTATKIIRAPVDDAGLTTILEIPPTNTLELGRCCEQNGRCCALLSCLLPLKWRGEFAADVLLEIRGNRARIQSICENTCVGPAMRRFYRHQHISRFRLP